MAQIQLKRTLTPNNPPASLADGEPALGLGEEAVTKRIIIPRGTIYTFRQTVSSPGWGNYNIRSAIHQMSLRPPALGGDHIRVTVLFGAGTNGTLDSLYVGEQAPAVWPGNWHFAATPVRLTFGGLGSISVVGGEYESDPIPFDYDPANVLLLAAHYSGTITLLEQTSGAEGTNTWWLGGADSGSQLAPTGAWANYANRACISPSATVEAIPPIIAFPIPHDFSSNNTIEAIGAGLNGGNAGKGATAAGAGGKAGCYAKINNFDPGAAKEIPFQIGEAGGTVGAGKVPTANSWFGDELIAAGGDNTTGNCLGDLAHPGGNGGAGQAGGGGGGGAGGPGGPGSAGSPGVGTTGGTAYAGGRGGAGGGGASGGVSVPPAYGASGQNGNEFGTIGAAGGGEGGGGASANNVNGYPGGPAGYYGAGGGGGGAALASGTGLGGFGGEANDGVIVVSYVTAAAIKMWVGTPGGVRELFAGGGSRAAVAETVEDAPEEAVYGRYNGEWMQAPIAAPIAPLNPSPNMLWCDTTTMRLHVYVQGQWNKVDLG